MPSALTIMLLVFGITAAIGFSFEERELSGEISKPASPPVGKQPDKEITDQGENEYYFEDQPSMEVREKRSSAGRSYEKNPMRFRGGIGLGSGYFSARLIGVYPFNRYFYIDLGGRYESSRGTHYEKIHYGPDLDLVFQLKNPTIFTPFIGAGIGYDAWKRSYDDEVFDKDGSMTSNYAYGLNLSLTKRFAIVITRKTVTYLNNPPIQWQDQTTPEQKTYAYNSVYFEVTF